MVVLVWFQVEAKKTDCAYWTDDLKLSHCVFYSWFSLEYPGKSNLVKAKELHWML